MIYLRSILVWLGLRPAPLIAPDDPPVDLRESSRRQAIREAEWMSYADSQSRVVRTVRSARMLPRRRVIAPIERVKVRRESEIR